MDLRNLIENKKRRLVDDYVNVLRNKIDDLSRIIWRDDEIDVFENQYDGKCVPFCYSRTYGKFAIGTSGFNGGLVLIKDFAISVFGVLSGTSINPRIDYLLPSRPSPGNIIVGREGAFHLTEMNWAGFSAVSYSDIGGAPNTVPIPGDIFDNFTSLRGGAMGEVNHTDQQLILASLGDTGVLAYDPIGFDLVLYEKKRGRALHEDRLPSEQISGAHYTNKSISKPIRFDPNSEIEPRVYITSPTRPQGGIQSVGEPVVGTVNFQRFMYINIMFKGYLELEV